MWYVKNGFPSDYVACVEQRYTFQFSVRVVTAGKHACSTHSTHTSSSTFCACVGTSMSSDKRALDELDALFRDIPAKTVSSSLWPATKLRNVGKASAPSTTAKPQNNSSAKRKRGGGGGAGHPRSAAGDPSYTEGLTFATMDN